MYAMPSYAFGLTFFPGFVASTVQPAIDQYLYSTPTFLDTQSYGSLNFS